MRVQICKFFLLILCLFSFLTGCSANHSGVVSGNSGSVYLSPTNITLAPGDTAVVTLYNHQNQALTNVTVNIPGGIGLVVTGLCTSIPVQGACTFTVTATSAAVAGSYNLLVSADGLPESNLKMLGVTSLSLQVNIAMTPLNYSFSLNASMLSLYQNSGSQSLVVTNSGNVPLTGIMMTNVPSGIIVSNGCTSLGVGQSCTFNISADNTSALGNLILTLIADNVNPSTINLTVQPQNQGPTATQLSVSPSSILLEKGDAQDVTLTNTGPNPIDGGLIFTGTGNDISVVGVGCLNLAAGASCSLNIAAATNSNNYTALPIEIMSANSSNSPTVAVTVGKPALTLAANYYPLELGNSLVISVTNNTGFTANNVTVLNLPIGVSSTNCASIAPGSGCNLTLTAANNATVGSYNNLSVGGSNTVNDPVFTLDVAPVLLSIPTGIFYVPTTGSVSLTITNTSTLTAAQNVTLTNLPPLVTATTCASIAPGGSCNVTVTGASATSIGPVPFDITGDNVAILTGQLVVEEPQIAISPIPLSFSGPGTTTVTVSNMSHFDISNVQQQLNNVSGITISNDTCLSGIASVGSLTLPSTCTFDVTAAANATNNGGSLEVTGMSMGNNLIQTSAISLASPTVIVNNNQAIVLPYQSGANIVVPVNVVAGGFALQNPGFGLVIGAGQQSNVTSTLVDANNINNPCPSPLPAGSSCYVSIINNTNLLPSDPDGDGQLTVTGTNISTVNTPLDVLGGAEITYIATTNPNYNSYYVNAIRGPRYGVIDVKNIGESADPSINISSISWLTSNSSMSIINRGTAGTDPVYGIYNECATTSSTGKVNTLGVGQECLVVVNASSRDPGSLLASLQVVAGNSVFSASRTFNLTNTTYLYIAGGATTAGGISANYIAQWNGASWSPLGVGASAMITDIAFDPAGNLYVVGAFGIIGGLSSNRVGKWNGISWSNLSGGGINNAAPTRVTWDIPSSSLYVTGDFSSVGSPSTTANGVAKWNGSTWSALGTGLSGSGGWSGLGIVSDGVGNIYTSGQLVNSAGGVSVNNVAKWNGSTWSALGAGLSGEANSVATIALNGTDLYATGSFNTSGVTTVRRVGMWNGSAWTQIGNGVSDSNHWVNDIDFIGTSIYIVGAFSRVNGASTLANKIAVWNGATWSALGANPVFNNNIIGITHDTSNNIYIAGRFTTIGSLTVNKVAMWNGSTWSALGSGFTGGDELRAELSNVLTIN